MVYFGTRDEVEAEAEAKTKDNNFKSAFTIDTSLSQIEADINWKKSMEELSNTLKRQNERANALSLAFDSVIRYHEYLPSAMLNATNSMEQTFKNNNPQTQNLSSTQLVDFIKENSIHTLHATQKLYRECTVKIYDLDRRKFNFGLYNRPIGRTNIVGEELFGVETITSHIQRLISLTQEYQEFNDKAKNEIELHSNKVPHVIDAFRSMIGVHEKDIELLNGEIQYYFTLRAMLQIT